jgi:N-acetylglucosaminyldiphosphoundecaprenol N-acetyl-beta-D-mannosaminyltransferase
MPLLVSQGRRGMPPHGRFDVLGVPVSTLTMENVLQALTEFLEKPAGSGPGAYICMRDVHGIVECQRDPTLKRIHEEATIVMPDGMPLVWWGRLQGHHLEHVRGTDLMRAVCSRSNCHGWRHFLYGGGPGLTEELAGVLSTRFPGVIIAGTYTPPFRPLSSIELREVIQRIIVTRANIVWVGLSSPRQEKFMGDIAPELPGRVFIGVGAAFDFLAGRKPEAPVWMQRSGLEWCFRLATEPRRLWRRYLVGNSIFLWLLASKLVCRRFA